MIERPLSRPTGRHHSSLKTAAIALVTIILPVVVSAQSGPNGTVEGNVVLVGRTGKRDIPPGSKIVAKKISTGDHDERELKQDGAFKFDLKQGAWDLEVEINLPGQKIYQNPKPLPVFIHFQTPLLSQVEVYADGAVNKTSLNRRQPLRRLTLVVYAQDEVTPGGPPSQTCPAVSGTANIFGYGAELFPVKGAHLAITLEGGESPVFESVSDNNGRYSIPAGRLQPDAAYTIGVTKPGYYAVSLTGTCATLSELIILTAEATSGLPLVQLLEPARRNLLTSEIIAELPLEKIRNFDSLALLFAGVLPAPMNGDNRGPGIGPEIGAPGQYSVNGARSRENNFQFDGSDNNDEEFGVRRQGFVSPAPEAVDSVTEFQVITALADARYGRNIGGQIDALTQSGGRQYHGAAYGFLSNQRLNARNYFNAPPVALAKPSILLDGEPVTPGPPPSDADPFTRSQAGFNLSGPLFPKRGNQDSGTFLFIALERQAIRASTSTHFNVPSIDQRGIFDTGRTGTPIGTSTLYPSSLAGDAIFSLFPLPNNPTGPYGVNTYTARLSSDADGYLGSVDLDHRIRKCR